MREVQMKLASVQLVPVMVLQLQLVRVLKLTVVRLR
jgi:hypothetical protein